MAQQIINCPDQGITKRMFLQARVLELIRLQLTPILADQGGLQPSPRLKAETIACIHHAKEILLSRLENPPSILELSQMVGMSDACGGLRLRTLQRRFQELFSTTPFSYLSQKRMEWAEQLLRQGNMTIAEVANKIGYSHLGHFAAAFKRRSVTNIDVSTVRVTVVGVAAMPTVELFDDNVGLVFGVNSAAIAISPPQKPTSETKPEEPTAQQQDEPIELVVTGELDGYRVPNTSVGTRTDTLLRDIPQSIQVIPQQVIKDQQATSLTDVLKNAPGVVVGSRSPRDPLNIIKIRGFDASTDILVNGIQDRSIPSVGFFSNIERIEVLKGPASVLFGQGGLGGKVNLVTKQPLRDPFYSGETSVGSYNSYDGAENAIASQYPNNFLD
ncbi:TonB-dependent receptor plug domain-containing protein [Nostoc sp.]|uniref:TonB-dependent receptor plug domain-containing protein n=1 Tax=Nostoc sp. TaxID=1180 RepID=UPI002FFB480C